MDPSISVALVGIIPQLVWTLLIVAAILRYRRPLGTMLSRISKIRLPGGVEAEFQDQREQLIKASESYAAHWNEDAIRGVIERAERIRDLLKGTRVLWVDDHFLANATIFRFLNAYGVMVDSAASTEEAITALRWASDAYEVVVTDMMRGEDPIAGLTLINQIQSESIVKPVLIFVARLDKTKGTPPGAVAITDSPIHLIHNIMNLVETERAAPDAATGRLLQRPQFAPQSVNNSLPSAQSGERPLQ
ncbi:MAG: response regulator [Chloroflexota bacterium]